MIKVIALIKRNPALDHDEFVRYWKEVHAPLVKDRLPGLEKYVLNSVIQRGSEPLEWDGVVELHYADLAARDRASVSSSFLDERRQASSAHLIDLSSVIAVVAEEHVVPLTGHDRAS